MTVIDDLAQAAAWPTIAAMYGEPVTIVDADGTVREGITAVVTRHPPERLSDVLGGRALANNLVIRFENHATRGLASELLDTGRTRVRVSVRKGETPTELGCRKLLGDVGGMTKVQAS